MLDMSADALSLLEEMISDSGSISTLNPLLTGVAVGVIHALSPGHGKFILATTIVGASPQFSAAVRSGFLLSITHGAAGLLLAWFGVSIGAFFGAGLESPQTWGYISGAVLLILAIQMLWASTVERQRAKPDRECVTIGFAAGLLPCPLIILVLSTAGAQSAQYAGLSLLLALLLGMSITTVFVAVLFTWVRRTMAIQMIAHPSSLISIAATLRIVVSIELAAMALHRMVSSAA